MMENKLLLKTIINEINNNSKNELPSEINELFDVVNFIYSFDYNDAPNCSDVFIKYDRLCKKIDVVGMIYAFYSPDLAKKMSETQLTQEQLERFSLNLMFLAVHNDDLKFINTLLKLIDNPALTINESLVLLVLECKERVLTVYE